MVVRRRMGYGVQKVGSAGRVSRAKSNSKSFVLGSWVL